ncbi:hypothetical protein Cgig2_004860 [Carnegiea gigantea]|uniref:Protein kinase domain-containing protein n=1 Tax=Carnegiea gigantea TaxID=171969 RepID=A0A9Q1QPH4_9CARY|nr:hypothetical protein Cgig2_004860 [Carnegiea gigantea]
MSPALPLVHFDILWYLFCLIAKRSELDANWFNNWKTKAFPVEIGWNLDLGVNGLSCYKTGFVQLSALLSDIGLNIREAHVFSTTDGYSLDVFVVDGWPVEDADSLYKAMEEAISRSEDSWSGSSHSQFSVEKELAAQRKAGYWEIDRNLLKIGERIASGSCGDLYHGVYLGQNVAIKILKSDQLTEALEDEFTQEVAILR